MQLQKMLIGLLITTVAATTCLAEDQAEARVLEREMQKEMKLEPAAYLGVSAQPMSPALASQLSMPRGVGLAVVHVIPESPAAQADLRVHDVLHKLGEQLLINSEQLGVLVRMHKADDEVKLTIIRGGKPQTISATLIEKDLPPLGPGGQYQRRLWRRLLGNSGRRIKDINYDLSHHATEVYDATRQHMKALGAESKEQFEQFRQKLEQQIEEHKGDADAALEQIRHLIEQSRDEAKSAFDKARVNVANLIAPDARPFPSLPPVEVEGEYRDGKLINQMLRWKDETGVIELRAFDANNWIVTVTGNDGEMTYTTVLQNRDLDGLNKDIRPKVRAMLDLIDAGE